MRIREPGPVPAFWLLQMPTDSGSQRAAASKLIESGMGNA
jgi:hypothetical protein